MALNATFQRQEQPVVGVEITVVVLVIRSEATQPLSAIVMVVVTVVPPCVVVVDVTVSIRPPPQVVPSPEVPLPPVEPELPVWGVSYAITLPLLEPVLS